VLHDLLPAVVGDCRADDQHKPANGDALQENWERARQAFPLLPIDPLD